MSITSKQVDGILKKYANDPSYLINMLQDIQEKGNYLPQKALERVADKLEISASQIYHAATFFRAFSLEPRGEHYIQVCTGTACHLNGASKIVEEMERHCGCEHGKASPDGKFSVGTVNCVGACARAPVVVVNNNDYYTDMRAEKVAKFVRKLASSPKGAKK